MKKDKILVVGGAGYIGSHMALLLKEAGYEHVIIDNLSTGHRKAALSSNLIIGDIRDNDLLDYVFAHNHFTAVMHFASCIEVRESITNPLKYYSNNVAATLNLLESMLKHNVNKIIFSSSAAVYGIPKTEFIHESHSLIPINPYGKSKLMIEEIIKDCAASYNLKYGILRYFNAAGADHMGRLGEQHQPESHLIPLILQVVEGELPAIKIYGSDYPTLDGTCIRDYIHVFDICKAHLLALNAINRENNNIIYNLGTGKGYSVLEIISAVQRVTGCSIPIIQEARRKGDPAVLVADATSAKINLNWKPEYPDIDTIISHAYNTMKNYCI